MLWSERRLQLIEQGRWYQDRHADPETWTYPHFVGVFLLTELPHLLQAREETGAPVWLSEEVFPDQVQWIAVYQVAPGDIGAWWNRWVVLSRRRIAVQIVAQKPE